MSIKKKQPPKDTLVEEIDLTSFDISAIDLPIAKEKISTTSSSPVSETRKPLSQREIDAFDDNAVIPEDQNIEEDPIIKDEFDDDFEDPFNDDDDSEEK